MKRAIVTLAALVQITACSSGDEAPSPGMGGSGGTGNAAGSGASAGTPAAGSGGATAGMGNGGTAGGLSGGTSGAGAGTAGTGGSAGASAGAAGVGAAGAGTAGTAGSDTAGAGGMAGASGAGAGTAGTGGSAGATGTATFTVEVELASDVDASAPTTVGIVTWTADVGSLVEAHIEFGLDMTYGMTAPVDIALTDHRTLLLGMKPESTYHFRVVARDASLTYQSSDYTVETGPATDLVSLGGFDVANEAGRERGFIVMSYWSGDGSSIPFIIDADGDIVWWAEGGPNGGIARAVMSADGKNMWMITASNSGNPLQRVSMDGLDAQTYMGIVGSHDITPVSGETMAFLEYGESDCDSIYEIVPAGTTEEIWESQGVVTASGCHGNALRYSDTEDVYTFSDVSQDIFVVSRAGMLQWRLSERTTNGNMAWGGTQHGHHLLDESILIFANRGEGAMESSAIEYSLQGMELLRYSSGDFSANLGDVQRLPGGNTLVTFSNDSVMKEIDDTETVVLEINGAAGTRIGYAMWRPTLYGPPPSLSQ